MPKLAFRLLTLSLTLSAVAFGLVFVAGAMVLAKRFGIEQREIQTIVGGVASTVLDTGGQDVDTGVCNP